MTSLTGIPIVKANLKPAAFILDWIDSAQLPIRRFIGWSGMCVCVLGFAIKYQMLESLSKQFKIQTWYIPSVWFGQGWYPKLNTSMAQVISTEPLISAFSYLLVWKNRECWCHLTFREKERKKEWSQSDPMFIPSSLAWEFV